MSRAFASTADSAEKRSRFEQLADGVWCLTAEGDPNSGVVIGDDGVMVIDARATPAMAEELIGHIRKVTDKPIRQIVLTHYHAVRVLGASAYQAGSIIASEATLALIRERGEADMASEIQRFPRLFRAAESIPGLTWPNVVFAERLTVFMGRREVQIHHPGRGHTAGDTVVWLPAECVLFAGDLVEAGATPYCGDAHFADWPATLDRLAELPAAAMVPGRGPALRSEAEVKAAVAGTRAFLADLAEVVRAGIGAGHGLRRIYETALAGLSPVYGHWVIFEHCLPFNVSRCHDELTGHAHPRIWTAERDREMWQTLTG